ncbi:MAG TPA: hypothetical protein VEB23_04505 [Ramlibacter sp.]|nr:hypothetical protein [Ramlibacter sp.]
MKALSDSMRGMLVLIRMDGYITHPGRPLSTYYALERRGLVEGPVPHPLPHCAYMGWKVARLTAAGSKLLDDKGVAPTPVRCPHCNGSGRIGPSPLTTPVK